MTKNIIVGGLVGGIILFLLGGLFYALLLAEFFSSNMPEGMEVARRAEPNLVMIFAGNVALAILLAYILVNQKIKTFSEGAKVGLTVGLLVGLYLDLIMAGTTNLTTTNTMAADIAVSTLITAIGGGVIAFLLGKLQRDPSKQ